MNQCILVPELQNPCLLTSKITGGWSGVRGGDTEVPRCKKRGGPTSDVLLAYEPRGVSQELQVFISHAPKGRRSSESVRIL